MERKRFQECSKIVQIFRYRWYLLIPFKWLWYSYIKPFKVGKDELIDGKLIHTDKYFVLQGKELWSTLKGLAQGNMNWVWTMEEVIEKMNKKYPVDSLD